MVDNNIEKDIKEPRRLFYYTLVDLRNRRILVSKDKDNPNLFSFFNGETESKKNMRNDLIDHVYENLGYVTSSGYTNVGDSGHTTNNEKVSASMFFVHYNGSKLDINDEEVGWVSLDRVRDFEDKVGDSIDRYWIRSINWEGIY